MNARLASEYADLKETLAGSDRAWLLQTRPDGRLYEVEFEVRTLFRSDDGRIATQERVVGVVYLLHELHPLRPPLAIARCNDLFCPHVRDPRLPGPPPAAPLMCLGTYYPQLRLGNWVVATWEVLRWNRIATQNWLNPEAAAWARRELGHEARFPTDPREFWRNP